MPHTRPDYICPPDPSTQLVWRADAIRLAVTRGLVGQVYPVHQVGLPDAPDAPPALLTAYCCVVANKPVDHVLGYDALESSVYCDCAAAAYRRPCAHAGALLLYVHGLAPARARTPQGDARG